MKNNIYTSSNKIIGYTEVLDDKIIINTIGKPLVEIINKDDILKISSKDRSNEFILRLFNEYTLSIGEIASLYNVVYSNINRQLKSIPEWHSDKRGRRNSSYGHEFSEERRYNISKSHIGKKSKYPPYKRTPEIKNKISEGVRKYFKNHPEDPTPHINNWRNGKYDNVNFTRGIGGYITSIKINKRFFFRSLLELKYILMLEEDTSVNTYGYEDFKIIMDNGRSYTPDFIINENLVVELKSKKFVDTVNKDKVEYKKMQAEAYCKEHNMKYAIIYDDELDFKSDVMIQFIKNNKDIVDKYNIEFLQPERVYGSKK